MTALTAILKRPPVLIIGALSLLIVIILTYPPKEEESPPSSSTPTSLAVAVVNPTIRPLLRTATATGSFYPWQELTVGPEVGGYRVTQVHVDVGDSVKKGDELARLNTAMLEAELAAKTATLGKAKAQQVKAQSDFNRTKTLTTSKLLSEAELEGMQAQMLSSAAEVELAQANLDSAELRLRYTRILAPADGIISSREVNIGQIAQVNQQMFQLLRDGRIEWRAEMPEALLTQIHIGQNVTIKLADQSTLTGTVRVISPKVNTLNHTGMIFVAIPDPQQARSGMFARGDFSLGQTTAKMLPLAAVVSHDGYSYIFVLKEDSTVERRHIETGTIDGDSIEVLSGLQPEEYAVISGAGFLKDGDLVRVVTGAQL